MRHYTSEAAPDVRHITTEESLEVPMFRIRIILTTSTIERAKLFLARGGALLLCVLLVPIAAHASLFDFGISSPQTLFTITYLLEYLFVIDFLVSARLWSPRLLSVLRFLSGKTSFWKFHGMEETSSSRFVTGGHNTRTFIVDAGIEVPPCRSNAFIQTLSARPSADQLCRETCRKQRRRSRWPAAFRSPTRSGPQREYAGRRWRGLR
jgi:hypothetical protein